MATMVRVCSSLVVLLWAWYMQESNVACQEEWEISQSRSPRAVLNFLPYTYIVSLLQAAQNCCDAPVLIPNYVQSQCGATATTRRYGGYRYRSRGRGFGGLFGTLVNGYGYQGRISNNGAAFTEQVLLNVCYADCAYQGLGLVNQSTFSSSASLNMDQISTLFSNATDYYPDWSDVVSNATDYCSSKASTSPRAIRTFSGRICSTYPLKFSICVRRYLLQNCLSDNTTQGSQCDSAFSNLAAAADGFSLRPYFNTNSRYRLLL